MFDIGFWEMAFIAVIALVIIGPERLPGAAHRVGIWVGKSRRMLNEVMSDVKKEMKEYDVKQVKTLGEEFKSASDQLKDITQSTSDALGLQEIGKVGSEFKKSIEEVSSTSSPSVQKAGKANEKPKRKPSTKTAVKKPAPRKKTKTKPKTKPKTKTVKKTSSKKSASKAASPSPQKK